MQNKTHLHGARALMITMAILLSALSIVARAQNAQSQAKDAAPKLVIKQLERSFGEIKIGAVATHTFTFRNEGKADLEIKSVAPS
jgi:hypothetical protein